MSGPQILQVKYFLKNPMKSSNIFYAYINIHELCTVVHLVFDLKAEKIKKPP